MMMDIADIEDRIVTALTSRANELQALVNGADMLEDLERATGLRDGVIQSLRSVERIFREIKEGR
jgi:predicted transcriptional regulator